MFALSPGQRDSSVSSQVTASCKKKLASTCVQILFPPMCVQAIASQRKRTRGLAKRSRKLTQVFRALQLWLGKLPFSQGSRRHDTKKS